MAPSSSLLARLSEVLGRQRSAATPPADFHFDLRGAFQRAGITGGERRSRANFVSNEPQNDGLPRADAGIDKPRHAKSFVDPYMAAIDRH